MRRRWGRGAAEVPVAGHELRYLVRVGIPGGDGETSTIRVLFVKSFDVPPCKEAVVKE